jgi:hypothetical protein
MSGGSTIVLPVFSSAPPLLRLATRTEVEP